MGKTTPTTRNSIATFSVPKCIAAVTLAVVIVFALTVIAGKGHATNGGKLILLSTTVIETPSANQPNPNQSEQSKQWESVRMRVTAYCPCAKCCGRYADGVTACNHKIEAGDTFVAADSRYAFGTEMVVAGYNNSQTIRVLDRGGAITGDRLDVFFQTHQQALEWGVQYIDVKVVRN